MLIIIIIIILVSQVSLVLVLYLFGTVLVLPRVSPPRDVVNQIPTVFVMVSVDLAALKKVSFIDYYRHV
jgi:hypothetical protein